MGRVVAVEKKDEGVPEEKGKEEKQAGEVVDGKKGEIQVGEKIVGGHKAGDGDVQVAEKVDDVGQAEHDGGHQDKDVEKQQDGSEAVGYRRKVRSGRAQTILR
ncbi:hypothetical protein BVRB_1g014490 [Beta vulgaris subsp. vulgaris]|nr:hypothetical protein BVRB_1g014490 [Beta vulgaris subsp. vulgaris]